MRPISELVEERQTAARQVAQLNKRLEDLDRELFARLGQALQALGVGAFESVAGEKNGAQMRIFTNVPLPPIRRRRTTIGETLADASLAILRTHGKPMKLNALVNALEQAKVHVPGEKPANNLSAHLSRSDKFVRSGEGWWLAEKKEPHEGGS